MDDFLYTCSVSYITDVLQTGAQLTRWENEQLTSSPRGNDVPGIRTIFVITCKTRVAWLAVPQMEVVLVHEKARWREILTRFRDISEIRTSTRSSERCYYSKIYGISARCIYVCIRINKIEFNGGTRASLILRVQRFCIILFSFATRISLQVQ